MPTLNVMPIIPLPPVSLLPPLLALNYKRAIAVVLAGPQLQARTRTARARTRTASPESEWTPPDLNYKLLITMVPPILDHKEFPKIYQIEC